MEQLKNLFILNIFYPIINFIHIRFQLMDENNKAIFYIYP